MKKNKLFNDCIKSDFDTKWYKKWSNEMHPTLNFTRHDNKKLPKKQKHNKIWQSSIITEKLWQEGLLKKGKAGIGFGVGTEMLPSLFAKYYVKVLATDQGGLKDDSKMWSGGSQLASELDDCFYENIVSESNFKKYVQFRPVDMNDLSNIEKNKYDFLWSNCAMGHIGGMSKTEDFVINSLSVLKDGGWAVHTTELNISALTKSIPDNPSIVIWTLKKIEDLFEKLSKDGHYVEDFRIRLIGDKQDIEIDLPPYCQNEYHMKLELDGFIACQIFFSIKKLGGINPRLVENNLLNRRALEAFWESMGINMQNFNTDFFQKNEFLLKNDIKSIDSIVQVKRIVTINRILIKLRNKIRRKLAS